MQDNATILLVDDTKENLDVLLELLSDYDLIPARSGAAALSIAQGEKIDLILLDIMMPRMDGFEICARLKADPATASVPVIFLSARGDTQAIEKGFALGGIDYITKPIEPRELLVRIKNHLELQSYKKHLETRVQEEVQNTLISREILLQQSKQAALGELLMHISHQWKQPLCELSSITTLMHSNFERGIKPKKEEEYETLKRLDEIIEFMSDTITTFAAFYKPNNLQTKFSAQESIEKTLSLLLPTFYYDFIDVTLEPLQPCFLHANENHFSQILFCILSNAREIFKQRKTPSPKICITLKHDCISVEDNGGGIGEEEMPKIFEPFFTTHASSGFGLYLADTIARKNGWKLSCANAANGACFSLEVVPCDP